MGVAPPTQTHSAVLKMTACHYGHLTEPVTAMLLSPLSACQPDSLPPPLPILHLHVLDKSTLNCIPFYSNDALNRLHSKFIFS